MGPGLPAASVSAAVTLNVPWPCASIVAVGTVTVALLPEISPASSVWLTVWPPQLMVSVSPATAPLPVRSTTTGVPSEASMALMPPPLFSGIDVIVGAVGETVSTVTAWLAVLAPTLPAVPTTRAW